MRALTPATATDLYELTMAAGYWADRRTERAVFELFVRHLPPGRPYLLAAGMEDALDYLESFRFTAEEIAYLRGLPVFVDTATGFFDSLAKLRFTGDVWAAPEGTPVFAGEPILTVIAPIIEAQIVETALLALTCYPTSVATKAARVVHAARGRDVIEFGARRAPGTDAALLAARSAYIGGCVGTSNVEAGFRFGIPVFGTIAHSWVMSFENEADAFRAYQRAFPHNSVLLIDTYDTLAAARRITEVFRPEEVAGVRLDSGDLLDLSRGVRAILDAAGFVRSRILASGDLNEGLVEQLVAAGAPIDAFGVGTDLTTVRDAPALGGVYKLVELRRDGEKILKGKTSEGKATYPGQKQIWRQSDRSGTFARDIVTLVDEPPPSKDAVPILAPVMCDGRRTAGLAALPDIRSRTQAQIASLPARLLGPDPPAEPYAVHFSEEIQKALEQIRSIHVREE